MATTDSVSYTLSGSASFDISALIASANATFGISVSSDSSETSSWQYTIDIPSGTWRAMFYHEAARYEVGDWVENAACHEVWSSEEWMNAPYSATNSNTLDIAKEAYPGQAYTSWPA